MSLKDIEIGIKKIKEILLTDIEKQMKLLGISNEKIYISEEISHLLNVNSKYKRNQILNVLANECENNEVLLNDKKVRGKVLNTFVRECAFSLINKLCAIRLLEERNIISPTIKKFKEYGDKSEVQKNLGHIAYSLFENDTYNGLKESIEATLRELSFQIKVLFEMNDEHSLIFPEHRTLKDVIKVLIDEIPQEDWNRDDFVGWMYQYFVEDEKEQIEQANTPEELAAKTQVYTYDWIVKYIVDYTIDSYCEQLKLNPELKKSVEEIKLIDPACGSGSFLVYAFDKFYKLYKEEGIVLEENIPNYIISKNVYGLDIDERAIQLAALNLYIKVKTSNRDAIIDKFNLICTNSRIREEVNIEKHLNTINMNSKVRDIVKKIIRESFQYIHRNNLLGSLMKIEDIVNPLIDEFTEGKRRYSKREIQAKREKILLEKEQLSLFPAEKEQLSLDDIEFETREEFVDYLRATILNCVEYIVYKINKDNDINSRMFAKDLDRGSNFINASIQKYEIVVGNPPYLYQRKMGDSLKKLLYSIYPDVNRDIYAAFILRMNLLNTEDGYCGVLTPDTYTTLGVYIYLRKWILANRSLVKYVQLGKSIFKSVNVSVGISIIKNCLKETNISFSEGKDNEDELLINSENTIDKNKILSIQSLPFNYDTVSGLYEVYENSKNLEPYYGEVKNGIQTGDNYNRVLMRWEVPLKTLGERWILYAKGGGFNRYLGRPDYVIDWSTEAREYYEKSPHARIRDKKYHFRFGITYSDITSNNLFSARILSDNHLFDVTGSSIFLSNLSLKVLLGLINSKFMNYILSLINPTVHFQISDIKKIPICDNMDLSENNDISKFCNYILFLKLQNYKNDVLSEVFEDDGISTLISSKDKAKRIYIINLCNIFFNNKANNEILLEECQYIVDELVYKVYGVKLKEITKIEEQFGISQIKYPIFKDFFYMPLHPSKIDSNDVEPIRTDKESIESIISDCQHSIKSINNYYKHGLVYEDELYAEPNYVDLNDVELSGFIEKIKALADVKGNSIFNISSELKIHPRSILAVMNKYSIYLKDDLINNCKRYLQTVARKAFEEDNDGIVLLADVLNTIHDELNNVFGDIATSIETEIVNIIGMDIEKWLRDEYACDYINNTGYDKKKDKYGEIKNPWEPLVWKGQTQKKYFTVFVWRYKITPDTELKIRSQYLEDEIDNLKSRIRDIDGQLIGFEGNARNRLEKERDELLNKVDDMRNYHSWISENGIKLRGMWFNWEK